jgi:hypothetical protein
MISYCFFDVLEHKRMVANFAQLHDGVHQCLCAAYEKHNEQTQYPNN